MLPDPRGSLPAAATGSRLLEDRLAAEARSDKDGLWVVGQSEFLT